MFFNQASKEKSKLRLAIFGPSGSGKTYSALSIATGLGSNIAVIDTEHKTASKYADRFNFKVCNLDFPSIHNLIKVIKQAQEFDVLIIDSLSHSWQELLTEINNIANAKFRGNNWAAWSEGNPKQRQLIEELLSYSGHLICTMRSKTDWGVDTENGKTKPVRQGLAPIQGKDIEYEFDLLIELSTSHMANIIKDRTGKFQDQIIEKPGKTFGLDLIDWLNSGSESYFINLQSDIKKCNSINNLLKIKEELNIEANKIKLTDIELIKMRSIYKEQEDYLNHHKSEKIYITKE